MKYKNLTIINILKNTNNISQILSYLYQENGLKKITQQEFDFLNKLIVNDLILCINNSLNTSEEKIKLDKKLVSVILKNLTLMKKVDPSILEGNKELIDCIQKSYLFEAIKLIKVYNVLQKILDEKELKNIIILYMQCKYKIEKKVIKKIFNFLVKKITIKSSKSIEEYINRIEKTYKFIEENCEENISLNSEKRSINE